MKLFNKLQEKLLQRDLKNDKPVEYMVKKYPVSLLVEKGVLKRYKDTAFYCADTHSGVLKLAQYYNMRALYTIGGEMIGEELYRSHAYLTKDDNNQSKYIIVAGHANFGNTNDTKSYAVYEKDGNCVVPHGCYQEIYMTDSYTILSLPERKYGKGNAYIFRKSDDQDERYQKILGNTICPQALIVGDEKIVTTKYSSIFSIRENKNSYTDEYVTNTIWFGQCDNICTKSLKIDKRLAVKETYKLPIYIDKNMIFFDEETKAMYYFTKGPSPKRVNLRNGEEVDLLSLKKIEKTKETMSMKTLSSQMTES
ncbi:MAG: hypothetical protein IKA36_00875, partial [Clostridia bacterium]|nr:hypothetical protein [Clostridia bacterium]